MRVKVDEEEHLAPYGEFCVRCGVSILDLEEPADEDENRWRVWAGWAALLVGGISLIVSNLLRPTERPSPTDEPSATTQWGYMAAKYGSYLLAVGIVLLLTSPALRKRRR